MSEIKEILEGFNAGYLIEKKQPALAKQLHSAVSEVEEDFFQGFIQGREEFTKERSKSKLIDRLRDDFSKPLPSSSKEKGKGKDIDMDIDR